MDKRISLPSSIDGKPLAYDFGTEQVCVIRGQEPDFNKVIVGAELKFIPEPTNPYDKNAIAVYSNEYKIGYLYKGKVQDMVHDFMRAHDPIYSCVYSVDPESKKIYMLVGFYREKVSAKEFKTFILTGNKNEEMQDNISFAEEGEEISYYYDFEKDKYLACSDIGDIGYFPKSAEQYLENECAAVIQSIEEDDETGKNEVIVAISIDN